MQEHQHPRARPTDHIAAQAREGGRARRARVDHRRDPRADAQYVRVDAVEAHALVDVNVAVDQAGGHQRAVQRADLGVLGGHVAADGDDPAVLDAHVQRRVEATPRVHDAAAFEHQRHLSPPRARCLTCQQPSNVCLTVPPVPTPAQMGLLRYVRAPNH